MKLYNYAIFFSFIYAWFFLGGHNVLHNYYDNVADSLEFYQKSSELINY